VGPFTLVASSRSEYAVPAGPSSQHWFGTTDLHKLEVYESKAGGYAALRKLNSFR
jgi:hypothetical protein